MATYSKTPAWIQRRISGRPVARWIAWNAGRPRAPEAVAREPLAAAEPDYGDNVVFLFRRTA